MQSFLRDEAIDFGNLALMQKQFAHPVRVGIEITRLRILIDVQIVE